MLVILTMLKEQEPVYNALDWPSNWFWNYNSYERAVDQDPFTCWTSYHSNFAFVE